MNINSSRQIVTGVAGAGVRVGQYQQDGPVGLTLINQQAGNGPCWTGNRVLLDYFPVGLSTCNPDGSDLQPFAPPRPCTAYGANDPGLMAAWALYLADGGVTGVQTSWGLSMSNRAWLGMGPALFVKPPSGDSIECYDLGAFSARWTQAGVTIDFFAVDADTVIWTDGSRRLQVRNLPEPAQNESINFPSTFVANGRRWLVYARGVGGFVIRPWEDATKGFIIVPAGQVAFGPTVIPGDDDSHVIAFWGANAAETAIMAFTQDLNTPMVDIEPAPPVTVPPFSNPVATGCCFPSRS